MKLKTYFIFLIITISFLGFSQENLCYINAEPAEFQLHIDSCINELILDVRPVDLFKNKAIHNAINVPTMADLDSLTNNLDKETPLLVYCAIGVRSTKACKILCDKNFKLVVNLDGGIEKWKKKDFEIEKIKGE